MPELSTVPHAERIGEEYLQGQRDAARLNRVFDSMIEQSLDDDERASLLALHERLTATQNGRVALVYGSMEIYDKDDLDIKGGGGLGVLAADTRRVCQQLGIPQVVLTPFYPKEGHQEIVDNWQRERPEKQDPNRLHTFLGRTMLNTMIDSDIQLDIYGRQLGSTTVLTVTEPDFRELYHGNNNSNHRLYQEAALGFGGYKALKAQDITPLFTQMNEAPVVFLAVAQLDDLVGRGLPLDEALAQTRAQTLFTNHTLVPAAEAEFGRAQFEHFIMPNIGSEEVRNWVHSMFDEEGRMKLSLLAAEVSGVKNGVSKLHAAVAEYYDKAGNRVEFEAVTNGISDKWINPGILKHFYENGIYDEFGAPAPGYKEAIDNLDVETIRQFKAEGRTLLNGVLAHRKDQYGDPIEIPSDAVLFNFKRRFVNYKRPGLPFSDPERLAELLEENNAHFILTGKPHQNDDGMKDELHYVLTLIDQDQRLKERVHYIQDYDEELGRALSIGSDVAINIPEVGKEACGTSWMKDIANFELLISTPDGGVADIMPIECLEVSGDEREMTYVRIQEAAQIVRDDTKLKAEVARELGAYLPTISGARMMFDYLRLIARTLSRG